MIDCTGGRRKIQRRIDGRSPVGTVCRPWDATSLTTLRASGLSGAFGRRPTADELEDYKHSLDERDRLSLDNALPIFNRLRQSHGAVAPLPVDPSEWESPRANGARVHPEPKPLRPKPPQADLVQSTKSVSTLASSTESRPAGNGRLPAPKRAEAIVREQLANGPVPGDLVKAIAAEAKVSERFLIAAAERLGVRTRRGQWWLPG